MKKTLLYLLSGILLFIAGSAGISFYSLHTTTIVTNDKAIYYLRPGTPKKVAIAQLAEQGLIPYPSMLSLYVYFHPNDHLKTGEYLFPKGSTALSVWKQITQGTGLLYRPFTIIPGWSFTQLRQALAQTEGLRHQTQNLNDQQVMAQLGYQNLAPEGEFLPETYYYTRGISDLVILNRAISLMQKKLTLAWQTRAPNLPYKNEYEALIAASLIEKEAYLNAERPVIAGVLINRLRKDMLLQFDPTVIYGMGPRFTGKIHKEDLQEDTLYNTYVHKGLPPTPIAMPSLLSINAALHPEQNDYYYFVAKGDGSHQFSKTLTEHNAAVSAAIKSHVSFFNENKMQKYLFNLIVMRTQLRMNEKMLASLTK